MQPRREVIGDAELWLGDSVEVLTMLDNKADAIITDPPYSSGGMVRGDRTLSTQTKYQSTGVQTLHPEFSGDNRDQRGFLAWASLWLSYALDATAPGGACVIFSDWRQLPTVTDALQSGGWVWRGIVPWNKVNARPVPNRFRAQCEYAVWGTHGPREMSPDADSVYLPGILTEIPPEISEREHITQKPVGIFQTLAQIAPRGGLIVDPFMGSGTTGIAALDMGRRFVGIERDATIYDSARRRIDATQRQGRLIP